MIGTVTIIAAILTGIAAALVSGIVFVGSCKPHRHGEEEAKTK